MICFNRDKRGLSAAEILIGIVIVGIILAISMNLMSSGLRGADKGMSHLNLTQSAAILMAQIEYDLLRASHILDPGPGLTDNVARWELLTESSSGYGTVTYNHFPAGIERNFSTDSDSEKYVFCKGLQTEISFRHIFFADPVNASEKLGMWVTLRVKAPEKFGNSEEFSMKRLFMCKNIINSL